MLASLDDAEIARMSAKGGAGALEELERRNRFENAWSGTWSSGLTPPIPAHWNRPRKQESLSGKLQDRKKFRKLWGQFRNGNKVQAAAAAFILRTRYNQSVP